MLLLAPLALAFTPLASGGSTVVLEPIRDNTLFESPVGNSNGAGQFLFVGNTGQGSPRRAVMAFDVAGSVPAGSTITSATITVDMNQTSSGDVDVTAHRVTSDWGEGASNTNGGLGAPAEAGDATWLFAFFPTTAWTSHGGDFVSTASSATTMGGPGSYVFPTTTDLVADAQSFLDSPSTNFGWLLRTDELNLQETKRLTSRESSNSGSRPFLTIEFDPPFTAEPATISLAAGGTQSMSLDLDASRAGDVYWTFGSATGTSPGIPFPGSILLPLNFDAYFNLALTRPFLGVFGSFLGVLDANGDAAPSLTIPPGSDPGLAGVTLYHAVTIAEVVGIVDAATNATSVTLVP